MKGFDYIIVGAGSAGCVLANRLSEDPGTTVLLIEAGGRDSSFLIEVPKGFAKLFDDRRYTWDYQIRPIGPSKRVEHWPRGKTLGGSSAINGMVYNRGSRADYDELERLGNPGWGWDTILPIFKQIENNELGGSDIRGSGGPLDISTTQEPERVCEEMISAGVQMGWRRVRDVNASDDERIGYTMATIGNGRRCSAATAFLHPIEHRPNLTVITHTLALRLLIEGGRCVGVRVRQDGQIVDLAANAEVIVATGSIATPQLLQLSGIGPADTLRSAGVDVLVESPNVGARMREHRNFKLQFRLNRNLGYNKLLNTAPRQAVQGAKYLVGRQGLMAKPVTDVIAFGKTRPELDRPDIQLIMAPFSAGQQLPGEQLVLEREPGLVCIGSILRPTSEGSVHITSTDPGAPLDIHPNFWDTEYDRRVGLELLHKMRELFTMEPIARLIEAETLPGPTVRDDQDLLDNSLDYGYCGYHAMGTCAMGPNDDDVVDAQLRVRGVTDLRVVDCSILPTMVSGNLNAPIMAMAWRASDLILDGT